MLKQGRPATPRSWLYEDKEPEWIQKQVLNLVSSLTSKFDIIKRKEFEYNKFHEQGGVPKFNHEIREIILNSYTLCRQARPMYKTSIWKQAKEIVANKLQLHGQLRRWTYDEVYAKMKLKGTQDRFAAWPTGGHKDEAEIFNKACEMADDGRWRNTLSLILIRSYRGKLRRVDMMPFSVTLRELRYVDPLIEHIQRIKLIETTPMEGFDEVKKSMYITGTNRAPGMVFGGDSTKMDDHFGEDCTMEVYDVLKLAFPQSEWTRFKELCRFMHYIPRVWINDKKVVGKHGLASGSGFTNLFETIHDMIVLEVARLKSPEVKDARMIGDDYEVDMKKKGKYSKFFVNLFGQCGLPGNLDKQSDDYNSFEFLQRIGIKDYVNDTEKYVRMIYLLMSAMRSAIYPENYVDPELFNSDMFVCKIAQICENCVDHPMFEKWCRWIAKGQKDIIPFAKQKRSKIDKIWAKALSVRGIRESYNNEKQNKPLSTFKCIQIWAKM